MNLIFGQTHHIIFGMENHVLQVSILAKKLNRSCLGVCRSESLDKNIRVEAESFPQRPYESQSRLNVHSPVLERFSHRRPRGAGPALQKLDFTDSPAGRTVSLSVGRWSCCWCRWRWLPYRHKRPNPACSGCRSFEMCNRQCPAMTPPRCPARRR